MARVGHTSAQRKQPMHARSKSPGGSAPGGRSADAGGARATGEEPGQRPGSAARARPGDSPAPPSPATATARPVGHDATHRPHRSHPASSRSVIGRWPRLQTTSQTVQSVHRLASRRTCSGDAAPSSEKSAPPGQSERQKPARETVVSKSHTPAQHRRPTAERRGRTRAGRRCAPAAPAGTPAPRAGFPAPRVPPSTAPSTAKRTHPGSRRSSTGTPSLPSAQRTAWLSASSGRYGQSHPQKKRPSTTHQEQHRERRGEQAGLRTAREPRRRPTAAGPPARRRAPAPRPVAPTKSPAGQVRSAKRAARNGVPTTVSTLSASTVRRTRW